MIGKSEAVDRIISVRDRAVMPAEPYPNYLYHYTTATGLQGILQSKVLWATQFDFLNDPTEFLYARDFVKSHLRCRGDKIANALGDVDDLGNTAATYPHYVTSFCENGDLLSQWRGYSKFNDGYSIGFPFPRINAKPHGHFDRQLLKIIYEREQQADKLWKSEE